jgi:membrane protein required for colicin V production
VNALDIVILVVVALFALYGMKKGFIISLATLAGLLLGLYAALHFSNFFAGVIRSTIHPPPGWIPAISFAVTFLVVLIGVYFLGKSLEKLVDMVGMGILNHAAGAALGFAKGVLLLSIAFYLISLADPDGTMISAGMRDKSRFYSPVQKVFPWLMKVAKADLKIPF